MDVAGLVAGAGWGAGVNLYAVVAFLGWMGRIGFADVPDALQHPAVIGVAAGLYALEFLVDKVPYLDNVWDALHTVVRPVGAAALAVILVDASAVADAAAGGASGALALVSHSAKATTRAAINASPEPASNVVVSLAEDGLVAAVVVLAVRHPVAALGVVAVLTLAAGWLVVTLWGRARRMLARWRERRAAAARTGRGRRTG